MPIVPVRATIGVRALCLAADRRSAFGHRLIEGRERLLSLAVRQEALPIGIMRVLVAHPETVGGLQIRKLQATNVTDVAAVPVGAKKRTVPWIDGAWYCWTGVSVQADVPGCD